MYLHNSNILRCCGLVWIIFSYRAGNLMSPFNTETSAMLLVLDLSLIIFLLSSSSFLFCLLTGGILHLYFLTPLISFICAVMFFISESSVLFPECSFYPILFLFHGCNICAYF